MARGKGSLEPPLAVLEVPPAPPQSPGIQADKLAAFPHLSSAFQAGDGGPCAALICVSRCSVFPGLGLLLPAARALQPLQRNAALQPAGCQLSA